MPIDKAVQLRFKKKQHISTINYYTITLFYLILALIPDHWQFSFVMNFYISITDIAFL